MKKRKKVIYNGIIGLAGNPNVGKSTIFNNLTGLHQHTGNWPGKTVSSSSGEIKYKNKNYLINDLPGAYSLIAQSQEEEVTRNYICFKDYDVIVIVCDAVCLERNLNLVLQILEITNNVIVCINLLDEAKRKKINIDLKNLEKELKVPVIGTCARNKEGLQDLLKKIHIMINQEKAYQLKVIYSEKIEKAISKVEEQLNDLKFKRFIAIKLICQDKLFISELHKSLGYDIVDENLKNLLKKVRKELNLDQKELEDEIVKSITMKAEEISRKVITFENINYNKRDQKIDRILTSKKYGIPIMLSLLIFIFWFTIIGANYPSKLIYDFLFYIEDKLLLFLNFLKVPSIISNCLIHGIYRVLAWVVSVMLPPMAIFFPLFTLLEDLGYLPRIAFNLDRCFKNCKTCGKQALTMCMGFGCNAVGVTGARIIDSPRERLIAILTNVFVPCNGRFPAIISIITMFFIGFNSNISNSIFTTLILTLIILLGIFMTFFVSKLLSKTILRGMPSSFILELPPYRKPQFLKVIIRSILDRTLFVLGRAILVAAPAGLIIWLLANIDVSGISLLKQCSNFLDPLGNLMGLDGVILMAFILGFPANEIVIPLLIMGYMAIGNIMEFDSLLELKKLLLNNGWTYITALNFMIFSLFHFPCSTTCLTIKKETGSYKWTLISILLPTLIGFLICIMTNFILHLF